MNSTKICETLNLGAKASLCLSLALATSGWLVKVCDNVMSDDDLTHKLISFAINTTGLIASN